MTYNSIYRVFVPRAQGIPEFWLTVCKNVDLLAEMIQEHDEPILKHLTDIKVNFTESQPEVSSGGAREALRVELGPGGGARLALGEVARVAWRCFRCWMDVDLLGVSDVHTSFVPSWGR